MDDTDIHNCKDYMAQEEIGKLCDTCNELKPEGEYYKGKKDCIECYTRARRKGGTAEELIKQIEDGSFEVDQKWLLKELIGQYKDPKCRDRLKALQMIMQVSGYNENDTDDKAVMDSLIESMRNGK